MPPHRVEHFRDDLLAWADKNIRSFPWREPDSSLYQVLIAEFFLARTRAEVVERVYPRFIRVFPDLDAIRNAEMGEIEEVIRPMGLQNHRAIALKRIAEILEDDDIPTSPEELRTLPRVGEYVAHATLCFGLNEPLPIIDTNVERVYERILGEEWPESKEAQTRTLEEFLPEGKAREYNLALLDFGALICTAQSPQCERCFANTYCNFYRGGTRENGR